MNQIQFPTYIVNIPTRSNEILKYWITRNTVKINQWAEKVSYVPWKCQCGVKLGPKNAGVSAKIEEEEKEQHGGLDKKNENFERDFMRRRKRVTMARGKRKISRCSYSWYPVGPVRPCTPVLVHASHIGDCSSSRLQKKKGKKRKIEWASLSPRQARPTFAINAGRPANRASLNVSNFGSVRLVHRLQKWISFVPPLSMLNVPMKIIEIARFKF